EARQHECGIDPALEPIARVGGDAELASRLRDAGGIPQRRFDQHVRCRTRAAGLLSTHDAGKGFHAALVGNNAHGIVERVALAIERKEAFASLRPANDEITAYLGGIEYVQ